jgi:hypothetical protein
VARPATPRRPAGRRTGHLDRPTCRPAPDDPRAPAAPGAGPTADGPHLPAAPNQPIDQETLAELTPTAFWALLPATERKRLGLRLSQLVLKAVRPPVPTSPENH